MRAKFKCTSVTNREAYSDDINQQVVLIAVTNSPNKEDNDFAKYTPSGEFVMQITNLACKDFFVPGEDYYLDFTKIEKI